MGPGVYFASNANIGSMYCRPGKVFYRALIDMRDVYDPFRGFPEKFRGLGDTMRLEVEQQLGHKLMRGSPMEDGPWDFGDIVRTIGHEKARKVFIAKGIRGLYTHLPSGGLEIAVFDLSIIRDVEKARSVVFR